MSLLCYFPCKLCKNVCFSSGIVIILHFILTFCPKFKYYFYRPSPNSSEMDVKYPRNYKWLHRGLTMRRGWAYLEHSIRNIDSFWQLITICCDGPHIIRWGKSTFNVQLNTKICLKLSTCIPNDMIHKYHMNHLIYNCCLL